MSEQTIDEGRYIYANVMELMARIDALAKNEKNGSKIKAYKKVKNCLMGCEAVQLDQERKTVIRSSWEIEAASNNPKESAEE